MSELITSQPTPFQLIQQAITQNADVEKMEKLFALQQRWQADKARTAFFEAFSKFQDECPEIRKTKPVEFNGKLQYKYAPLADISRQIKSVCQKYGLTYRWEIQDTKEEIKVTCLITHIEGHTERTTMTANPDPSGSKNGIQARGSSIEYLKRYTLIGALGISTADEDIDGRIIEQTIDELHAQFMVLYNKVIQIDSTLTRYHPDNWKREATPRIYIKAIGEIRKVLTELTPKGA